MVYQVTKRIHGRFYLYLQRTYRVNGVVKTWNKYLGPVGAKLPPMRSLAKQMENLPEAHKKLRAEYDAGKMTKTQYLEAITAKPEQQAKLEAETHAAQIIIKYGWVLLSGKWRNPQHPGATSFRARHILEDYGIAYQEEK